MSTHDTVDISQFAPEYPASHAQLIEFCSVQFALHVHDRNWMDALRIGRQITDEFPNTRIAAEVRERLPILEEKAQQPVGV